MNNITEEITNSTQVFLNNFNFLNCQKQFAFEFIFSYCLITFCFLVGTLANSWCLWFYFRIGQEIKQSHVFLLNHIIIELIFCLVCAGQLLYMLFFRCSKFYLVINIFLCLSWSGRPLIQTCICIEQYLAVRHPIIFLRYKGKKYRNAAAVTVWLLSLGYSLYHINIMTYPDPILNSVFFVSIAVISFCCVSVLCALKHPGPGDTRTGRDIRNQQKRNAFGTIFTALILMLFSYLPQVLLVILISYNQDRALVTCRIVPSLNFFNICGIMITPIIKMYKDGHFKCRKCSMEIW